MEKQPPKVRKKTIANRARNRLLSIQHDVESFCRPTLTQLGTTIDWPIVANERCGSWYAFPLMTQSPTHSCYFKSTDGHFGTWNFSLKRLNLNIVRLVVHHGGCFILDASASKKMPDSFARTIPIWAAVLNRIAVRYRHELGLLPSLHWCDLDLELYTPDFIVTPEEHASIEALIESRVQTLYDSDAIVDPHWLATTLTKPLRPCWITPLHKKEEIDIDTNYFTVACLNCSDYPERNALNKNLDFVYTAGAADDHESWARGLTSQLFWAHAATIIDQTSTLDTSMEDSCDNVIDAIVQREKDLQVTFACENVPSTRESLFDEIGSTRVYIGTRRAGKPPECWLNFDAVLNVTDMEYTIPDDDTGMGSTTFYLQLPVTEGKRDKFELERWMAVGIVFIFAHAKHNRRILVHCAQGKDRSVAVAMAAFTIFCDLKFPLRWNKRFSLLSLDTLWNANHNDNPYRWSGLSDTLVQNMLGADGRDRLVAWVDSVRCDSATSIEPLATKASLLVTLLLLQQDREKAEPTRSTLQKLNRFFMSKTRPNKL